MFTSVSISLQAVLNLTASAAVVPIRFARIYTESPAAIAGLARLTSSFSAAIATTGRAAIAAV
ncbi:MAG: hypothetical protein IKN43_08105, partial [Selenomonadaceae bacterium]|nr:hypothetical protein [Selenomonadaceae bacterium]